MYTNTQQPAELRAYIAQTFAHLCEHIEQPWFATACVDLATDWRTLVTSEPPAKFALRLGAQAREALANYHRHAREGAERERLRKFTADAYRYVRHVYKGAPFYAGALAYVREWAPLHFGAGTCTADEFGELCAETANEQKV